jgi:hypothetical protein
MEVMDKLQQESQHREMQIQELAAALVLLAVVQES